MLISAVLIEKKKVDEQFDKPHGTSLTHKLHNKNRKQHRLMDI